MNSPLDWVVPLVPEEIVMVCALAALFVDLAFVRRKTLAVRAAAVGGTACLGCAAAMIWLALRPADNGVEMLALTPLTQFLKMALLGMTLVVAVLSFGARFSRHIGEYFALLLMAAAGLMLLISSENLLVIFIALEMLSLPLYVLTAFNKASPASAEAALKYFLFGSVAAAFTLFGISLLYGLTGGLELGPLAVKIAEKLKTPPIEPVYYAALVMTLAGFAFKVAAAPFHFWAPDVYEGAPAPIACFIASASKAGSFFVLARILVQGFSPMHGSAGWKEFQAGWMPVLAVLAVVSIVGGNIAALVQTRVKRLLAYSAIAHAGYALLAFFGNSRQMLPALFFYVITYALTVLGAFAVVAVVENGGSRDRLGDWAGLGRRAPLLSACMFVFMLSLAGVPPLAGFFGKFYVFTAALGGTTPGGKPDLAMLWLVIAAVVASAISLYYYLQVLKQIYSVEPPEDCQPLCQSNAALWSIALLAGLVIGFGCAPGWLLGKLPSVLNAAMIPL
ncbi:MAG TPA: NADH-quinone oxidoreductase subunit N [Candidatus Acidoferrum sp.]|nr:NADH-quinone oxidoreductase subunit N [Candidatus Acidoferrum sp.]